MVRKDDILAMLPRDGSGLPVRRLAYRLEVYTDEPQDLRGLRNSLHALEKRGFVKTWGDYSHRPHPQLLAARAMPEVC